MMNERNNDIELKLHAKYVFNKTMDPSDKQKALQMQKQVMIEDVETKKKHQIEALKTHGTCIHNFVIEVNDKNKYWINQINPTAPNMVEHLAQNIDTVLFTVSNMIQTQDIPLPNFDDLVTIAEKMYGNIVNDLKTNNSSLKEKQHYLAQQLVQLRNVINFGYLDLQGMNDKIKDHPYYEAYQNAIKKINDNLDDLDKQLEQAVANDDNLSKFLANVSFVNLFDVSTMIGNHISNYHQEIIVECTHYLKLHEKEINKIVTSTSKTDEEKQEELHKLNEEALQYAFSKLRVERNKACNEEIHKINRASIQSLIEIQKQKKAQFIERQTKPVETENEDELRQKKIKKLSLFHFEDENEEKNYEKELEDNKEENEDSKDVEFEPGKKYFTSDDTSDKAPYITTDKDGNVTLSMHISKALLPTVSNVGRTFKSGEWGEGLKLGAKAVGTALYEEIFWNKLLLPTAIVHVIGSALGIKSKDDFTSTFSSKEREKYQTALDQFAEIADPLSPIIIKCTDANVAFQSRANLENKGFRWIFGAGRRFDPDKSYVSPKDDPIIDHDKRNMARTGMFSKNLSDTGSFTQSRSHLLKETKFEDLDTDNNFENDQKNQLKK